MKLKYRLSIIVVIVLVVTTVLLAGSLLTRSSKEIVKLNIESITRMAATRAEYWKAREEGYIKAIRSLANIMADYETVAPEQRRTMYNNMLYGTLTSEPNVLLIYTVWKPNSVDGMDAQFAGRAGATAAGQYAVTYTRESGTVTSRTTVETNIAATMAYVNSTKNKIASVEDPIPRKINGTDTFVIRMMVPIVNPATNETVGGVGLLFRIDPIQSVVEKTIEANDDIAIMAIYTSNSCIIASYQPDRVGKLMSETSSILNQSDIVSRALNNGETALAKLYSPFIHTNVECVVVPFAIADSGKNWAVMIGTAEDRMMEEVRAMIRFTVLAELIAVVLIAVLMYRLISRVTSPLKSMTEAFGKIGEGDFTCKLAVRTKDEIGEISASFNQTIEKIKSLIGAIKQRTEDLTNIGTELAANMTESAAAVNEITSNIQSIRGRVTNQESSVIKTNGEMEQISGEIEKLDNHVELQTSSVSQSSSAIEEMLANIQSVTATLVRNADNVRELMEASEVGRAGLQGVSTDIQEIARESEGLLEINLVMDNIASQTNLLSMNAAIEAAHAGEAGKGFAVVADEIRKLAENSSSQSKTISAVLKKMKIAIDKITSSTGDVLGRFEAIEGGIKTVSDQESSIRNAMEEQGQGSKQVLEAVSQLNEITREVKGGSAQMLRGSKEVIEESKTLEQMSHELSNSMDEITIGVEQINIAVTRINDLCHKNHENISVMVNEIGVFKME
ncbi:MAG: methyl-accepting chemotaxis protein [Spirochaetaceae bacterium]|jgi:methyl-accepting chemotaxis protein|nr:methyl-accepting chemotaxis protein [Spirochaetaceae bacterium]